MFVKCCCSISKISDIIQREAVSICPKCGLITKKNIVPSNLEKERYDLHICDDGYRKYMRGIYESISPYIKKDCLDFGCGKIHLLADIIKENGYSCDYYDLYYYPEIKDKKYDTIILVEVFEHLQEPYTELLRLKNRLNKNGRIVIITKPYKNDLNNWWYFRDITHISFINKETFDHWNLNMNIRLINNDIFILDSIY